MFQRIKDNFIWVILAVLIAVAVFVWLMVFNQSASGEIKVDFFDVGQGSSIFLSAPNENQILIDGGPSDAVLAKLGEAMPVFDKKIELLVLTHPDSDHLSGLIEVLKRYTVSQILETGILDNTAEYKEWNSLIAQKNIPVVFAQVGQIIKVADNLSVKILYPLGKISGQDFSKNTNQSSIIGKIYYGKNSILFTGDAEANAEAPLVLSGADLKADILAVGHHGSKSSTSEEFLAAVAPQIAVIQVGVKNRYGHPAPETLEKLKSINIFRTDLMGDINFSCNLEKCWQAE
jgi:competence protein ComEC